MGPEILMYACIHRIELTGRSRKTRRMGLSKDF